MKAAILAAGLGTRLRPLTDLVPKTLIPVLNRPLLGLILAQVEDAGFSRVAVNSHHLSGQVQQFLASLPWGFNLSISPEPELLGTGGGLKRLGEILRGGPFLAVNGDILTDLDLGAIYRRPSGGRGLHPGVARLSALQQGLGGGGCGGQRRGTATG